MELNKRSLKDSNCWIYGYTQRNVGIAEKMILNGFVVKGYIDRRAEELRCNSTERILPVDTELGDKERDVLIILLLSVNSHLQVAKEMNERGWKFILFMAVGNSYGDDYADEMRRMYNRLINLEFSNNFFVMEYTEKRNARDNILRTYPNRVVVFVPIDLLFTDTPEHILDVNMCMGGGIFKKAISDILRFSDKNIIRMRLYRDFFDSMLLGQSTAADYIKVYSTLSGREEHDYLREREATLNIWEEEYLRVGMSYFIDGAAEVCYNPKGYFNILDGMHRLMYLIYKGNFNLPVAMSSADYIKFTQIYDIRENGKKPREIYRRRSCFIRILDKLDSLRVDNDIFDEAIVFSKDIYWAIIMKQNVTEKVTFVKTSKELEYETEEQCKQYNIDMTQDLYFSEKKRYIMYIDSEEVQKYEKIARDVYSSKGIIFVYGNMEEDSSMGKKNILYRDYEKKLICYE